MRGVEETQSSAELPLRGLGAVRRNFKPPGELSRDGPERGACPCALPGARCVSVWRAEHQGGAWHVRSSGWFEPTARPATIVDPRESVATLLKKWRSPTDLARRRLCTAVRSRGVTSSWLASNKLTAAVVAAKKWRSRPYEKRHFSPISSSFLTVLSVFFSIHFQSCANRRELSPKSTGFLPCSAANVFAAFFQGSPFLADPGRRPARAPG